MSAAGDLAAAKFGQREWRDRAMDLTKDLDELRSKLTDTERERDEARAALSNLVDNQWPCDTDNPHVEVWCIAHQTKRCDMDEVVAFARRALAASPTPARTICPECGHAAYGSNTLPTMTPATCPTCGWEQEPWLARRNPVNYCTDPFHRPTEGLTPTPPAEGTEG